MPADAKRNAHSTWRRSAVDTKVCVVVPATKHPGCFADRRCVVLQAVRRFVLPSAASVTKPAARTGTEPALVFLRESSLDPSLTSGRERSRTSCVASEQAAAGVLVFLCSNQ